LISAICPFHKETIDALQNEAREAQSVHMGSTAASLYYCTDYLSFQHLDDDVGCGICVQLEKRCADEDGFDFAYTEYGFYIATQANTAW
jgi:hypothetical protein